MRFKGYIINEGRSKKITEDQFLKGIQKNCKKMITATQRGKQLLRGNWLDNHWFGHVDPKSSYRSSANTNNLYTLVIDNHPKWKKYPKRSQSLICTTGTDTAENYGDVFMMFPKDGSRYGIVPSQDMWSGFSKTFGHNWLEEMNSDVYHFAVDNGVDPKPLTGSSYRDLVMFLTELDEKAIVNDIRVKYVISWAKNYYDNDFLKMLQEILDPNANGFRVTKDPSQLPKPGHDQEVWTDGESYMVSKDYLGKYGMEPIWSGKRESDE